MTPITALHNQTLLDIAIRHFGTIEALADIAVLNDISVTEELVPGQLIKLPSNDYGFQEIVNFFVSNKIEPACGLTDEDKVVIEADSGIGYWIIENNFIVQ